MLILSAILCGWLQSREPDDVEIEPAGTRPWHSAGSREECAPTENNTGGPVGVTPGGRRPGSAASARVPNRPPDPPPRTHSAALGPRLPPAAQTRSATRGRKSPGCAAAGPRAPSASRPGTRPAAPVGGSAVAGKPKGLCQCPSWSGRPPNHPLPSRTQAPPPAPTPGGPPAGPARPACATPGGQGPAEACLVAPDPHALCTLRARRWPGLVPSPGTRAQVGPLSRAQARSRPGHHWDRALGASLLQEVLQNGNSLWFKAKSPSCSSHRDRDQHLCLSPEASQGPTGAEVRRPADLGHQAERVAASHHQAHHESCSKHSGRSCSSNRAYLGCVNPEGLQPSWTSPGA
ncbi:uncharacterized protein AAEQ78_027379 [Lycaon pictus]